MGSYLQGGYAPPPPERPPTFFEQFMQGFLQGQQLQAAQRAQEQEQSERDLRLEALKHEQNRLKFEQNRIKLEDKIKAQTMNREGALGNLKFMEGINPPQETMPPGIMGPPQTTGPTSMQIPGISAPEAGINIPGLEAPVRYAPDMQRLMEDQAQREAALAAQKAMMTSQASAEGAAAVAQRPRQVPGQPGLEVPGDMLDNVFGALMQQAQQKGQQDFSASQAAIGRQHDYAMEGRRTADQRTLEQERRAAAQAEEARKPLSGEAAKVNAVAITLVPEAEQLKEAFRKDYNGALRGIVSGTDRRLSRLVDQVSDKVGRLRSGGAINGEEAARFRAQIASAKDLVFGDPQAAIDSIDGIIQEAQSVSQSIRPRGVGANTAASARPGPAPNLGSGGPPKATDGKGNVIEWNGSAWVPAR